MTHNSSFLCVGIPVKHFPDDLTVMPSVQYAVLIADLVVATKKTLGAIALDKDPSSQNFVHLRMRTTQDTEMIVTDYIAPGTGKEYNPHHCPLLIHTMTSAREHMFLG
jgi:hypothetical protein